VISAGSGRDRRAPRCWRCRSAFGRRGSPLTTFRELGVAPAIADALQAVGITTAFPIQAMTLPVALTGSDVIGHAKTGTGKTLAFGVPLLQRVVTPADREYDLVGDGKPQALVVVPTRELCIQVTSDLEKAGARRGVRILSVYGGRAYEPQVEALRTGVDVVVGTPGRLLDLAQQGLLDLRQVRGLVLDEADEMLDLGFLPDVERILARVPEGRQMLLFSATMPGAVVALARRYMRQPTNISAIDPDDEGATVAEVEQHVFRTHALDKVEVLARVLQAEGRGLVMIFCRTKRTAAQVADQLTDRGFAAAAVHGDLGQGAREQALRAFRSGKVDVLVATDVAARGIDVEGVTHVVNYSCPEDDKTYLHRIGRTARAGASGVALTFVDWEDTTRWSVINKALGLSFYEPVETYSTSPHLYTLLGIPEGARGVLPRAQRTRAGLAAEELEDLGETGRFRQRDGARGAHRDDRSPVRPGGRAGRVDDTPTQTGEDADRRAGQRSSRRRRTRGGRPVEPTESAATVAPEATDGGEGTRRRRRRGGRGRGQAGNAGQPVSETIAATGEA
jgi:superfamily II DNA/RNA helicase